MLASVFSWYYVKIGARQSFYENWSLAPVLYSFLTSLAYGTVCDLPHQNFSYCQQILQYGNWRWCTSTSSSWQNWPSEQFRSLSFLQFHSANINRYNLLHQQFWFLTNVFQFVFPHFHLSFLLDQFLYFALTSSSPLPRPMPSMHISFPLRL